MQDKLLTILLTQWDKPDWFEACLRSLDRQLPDDRVQLLIGDDGIRTAEQHGPPLGGLTYIKTLGVIERALRPEVHKNTHLIRWPEEKEKNTLHNLARTLLHAKGRWVWVLGNNDQVYDGAIPHLLDVIENLDERVRYLSFNYHGYHTGGGPPPQYPEDVQPTEQWNFFQNDKQFDRLAEIALKDWHSHTAIYSGAMRLDDWMSVRRLYLDAIERSDPRWSSASTTCPYTQWIYNHLLTEPVYYVARPMVLMNYDSTWKAEPGADNWSNMLTELRKELVWRVQNIYRQLGEKPPEDPKAGKPH